MKKIIKLQIIIILILYFILDIRLIYDLEKIKNEKNTNNGNIYYSLLIENNINIYEKDFLLNLYLYDCDFALKFIEHAKIVNFLKDERFIENLPKQLKRAFITCNMQEESIFFNQIDKDRKILLNKFLSEKNQIENIFNYYYLIEPNSLLSEMKRMNYQSRDALLIMEKLEIDIDWDKSKELNEGE